MKDINLFGDMQEYKEPEHPGRIKDLKKVMHYRTAVNKNISCKTCVHRVKKLGNSRSYFKCEIIGSSDSEATDIRLKDVCDKWEQTNET